MESLGRSEIAQLEDRYVSILIGGNDRIIIRVVLLYSVKGISAWSDLNHFNKGILDINFSDGSDWEDITKVRTV